MASGSRGAQSRDGADRREHGLAGDTKGKGHGGWTRGKGKPRVTGLWKTKAKEQGRKVQGSQQRGHVGPGRAALPPIARAIWTCHSQADRRPGGHTEELCLGVIRKV